MSNSCGNFQASDQQINRRERRKRQQQVCADGKNHDIDSDRKDGTETVKQDFIQRFLRETGRLAGMFTEESFPVQADGVIEEINGARCVQTKKEQRSRDFVVQNQMQGISYGEHGTYLIAYSKKALAFFFCAGTGENLIADDFGSERVSAEKAEDQCIGEISVKIREFSVDGIKNHGNQMQRLIFIHQTCEKKKRKQSGNDGSGPENQSFPCSFHTDFREKEQKAGKK